MRGRYHTVCQLVVVMETIGVAMVMSGGCHGDIVCVEVAMVIVAMDHRGARLSGNRGLLG